LLKEFGVYIVKEVFLGGVNVLAFHDVTQQRNNNLIAVGGLP
jgi:hypothetical protein